MVYCKRIFLQTPQELAALAAATKKKRTFRKFTFRGVDLDQLLDMSYEQLMTLVHARARRKFSRGKVGTENQQCLFQIMMVGSKVKMVLPTVQ